MSDEKKEKAGMAKMIIAPGVATAGWGLREHFTNKKNTKAALASIIGASTLGGAIGVSGAKDIRDAANS